jgi:DICT domain-containing protein
MKASEVIKWMQAYHPDEPLLISWVDREQFAVEDDNGLKRVATREWFSDIIQYFQDTEFMSEYDVNEMVDLVADAIKIEGRTEPAGKVTVQ